MDTDDSRKARFIAEYAAHANGQQAALAVGYTPGEAVRAVQVMLKDPAVQLALDAHRQKLFQGIEDEGERVLIECMRVAFCDFRRLLDAKGRLKPLAEIDADTLAGLRIFDPRPPFGRGRGVRRIRRHDKHAALKLLGKYLRLFGDDEEGGPADGLARDLEVDWTRVEETEAKEEPT